MTPMTTLTSEPTLALEFDTATDAVADAPAAVRTEAPTASARELRDAGIAERRARRAHEHATRNRRHDVAGWTMLVAGLAMSLGLFGAIAYNGSMAQLRDNGAVGSTR